MCTKQKKYRLLQQQFLCCYPIDKIAWSSLELPLELADQQELIAATCGHPSNVRRPVRRKYQEAFIKRLLDMLDDHEDVHDDIYNCLCSQLSNTTTAQSYAYKHYMLRAPYESIITLRESSSFVREGTTGLCTWEAALALADYLLHHPNLVRGKNIFELGAGAGLCGIVLKQCLRAGQVLLTDGSEPCVQLMRENVALNFGTTMDASLLPQCALLRWDEVSAFQWSQFAAPDLLLAADVIYDDTQFEALLTALDFIYKMRCNRIEMLLASTVRNATTLKKFMEQLNAQQYQVTTCENVSLPDSYFCRDHNADVQIVCIRRA